MDMFTCPRLRTHESTPRVRHGRGPGGVPRQQLHALPNCCLFLWGRWRLPRRPTHQLPNHGVKRLLSKPLLQHASTSAPTSTAWQTSDQGWQVSEFSSQKLICDLEVISPSSWLNTFLGWNTPLPEPGHRALCAGSLNDELSSQVPTLVIDFISILINFIMSNL